MSVILRSCIGRAGLLLLLGALLSKTPVSASELEQQIDTAILKASAWLVEEQQESGAWKKGKSGESTGITSLAVLALLASGHVPDEGPYGRQITQAVNWVLAQQNEQGLLVGPHTSHGPMYSHGISTLMLAEVSGMLPANRQEACRRGLENGIQLIIDAQNRPRSPMADGGWRYQPGSRDADLSVTAWQLLALRAARDIGCDVPVENIDRAIAYIKRLSVLDGGGFGYSTNHGTTATRAGTGIVALEVCGEHRSDETLAAARYLLTHPLVPDESYFYYGVYYCTVGMYKIGGDEWRAVRSDLYSTILQQQKTTGFWEPERGSERNVGRVYATSLSILALAIEYSYLPVYQR